MEGEKIMTDKMDSHAPSSMKTNILFAMSEFATNPMATILMALLVYFYTDVIGINPAVVGTILLVSRCMDGISDLIAGNIVDHTKSKAGVCRPWYLRMAIPFGLAFIILFTVPNWGPAGKAAYIFISYNLASTVAYTLVNAAMSAYPTFLTKNRASRSIMSTMRLFAACGTQIILMMFALRWVQALGGDQAAWIKFAAILGAIAAAVMIFIYANTRELSDGNDEKRETVSFLTGVKALLKNKYWFVLVFTFFLGVIVQVCTLTDGVYYAKYVLNDLNMQANLTLYFLVPNLLPMLVLPTLFKKGVSKRNLCILGAVLLLIGTGIGVAFPAGIGFIVGLALRGIGYGFNACCQAAMVFETVVYGEWRTGINIPAMTQTATSAAQKLGSGIGAALLGFVMSAAGYDGMAKVQPASAVHAINVIYMIVPAVLALIWIICFYFYRLDKDYPRYVEEIEARKAQKTKEAVQE